MQWLMPCHCWYRQQSARVLYHVQTSLNNSFLLFVHDPRKPVAECRPMVGLIKFYRIQTEMGRRQPAQQAIPWSYPGHSPGHGWAARGLYPPLDIVVLPPAPKSLDLRISHTGGNINCPMHFIRLQIKLYTTNPDQRDQRTHLAIVVAGTGEERTLPGEEEPWDSERRPRFRLP